MDVSHKLILVPTPIGNLDDISKRAFSALENCDAVYCEDTRVTGKLLAAYSIKKPMFRMDENLIARHVESLVERINSGETICYCSDAGMPGISDPGSRIVAACRKAGVEVEVLPGANACLLALVASGFNSTHFFFEGFLPKKKTQKSLRLQELMALDCPVVVYESPNRVLDTIRAIKEVDSERPVCAARELTKLYEEVIVLPATQMLSAFEKKVENGTCRGEFVLVIEGCPTITNSDSQTELLDEAREFVNELVECGVPKHKVRELLIKHFNVSKNKAYELSI